MPKKKKGADLLQDLLKLFTKLLAILVDKDLQIEDQKNEIHRLKEELKQARKDTLTGVPVRDVLVPQCRQMIELAWRQKVSVGFMIIDIDRFKGVNDTYGHLLGDEMLKKFGDILISMVRVSDVFGRYGGEEFLLLVYDASTQETLELAERIRGKAERHLTVACGDINVAATISIGVASSDSKGNPKETFEMIFKRADDALYKAKNTGRNKVCVDE